MSRVLDIAPSPHVRAPHSVERIMFDVVLALLPVTAWAIYAFGLAALAVLAVSVLSCVGLEHVFCRLKGEASTVSDWSAVITGLLLGLTLPPSLPLWMVVVGAVFAMGIGKHVFGGLGFNCFNPALVGRAMLQATFPVPMTTWLAFGAEGRFAGLPASTLTAPLSRPVVDAVSSATPLSAWKFGGELTEPLALATGATMGSAGETSAVLILLGGAFLVARHRMNWRITASVLGSAAALAAVLHLLDPARYAPASFMLLSGGLMLGAVFMATDMVGSPMTNTGCVVYGTFIGLLVIVIRTWGGMPEGVMYAILLGNALTPHIDALIQPRVFGTSLPRESPS